MAREKAAKSWKAGKVDAKDWGWGLDCLVFFGLWGLREGGGAWGETYAPFVFVEIVLGRLSASVEEYRFPDVFARFGLGGTLLHEATERRDPGAGADHDDGL